MSIVNTAGSNKGQSPKKEGRETEKKWGKPVINLGYSIIPSLIFHAQARLGLNSVQLVLLLHLADFWWNYEQKPFPSKSTLAKRLRLSPRQIQRHLTDLEKGGFIKREPRFAAHQGQQSNYYDLEGLVEKLKSLEPDFTHIKEQSRRVVKPGGLNVHAGLNN